jgi:predicted nucleic acid-binding protein
VALDLTRWTSRSVLLDTNAIIYFLAKFDRYAAVLQPLFQGAASGQFALVASVVTEAEVRVRPEATGDQAALAAIDEFFQRFPGLTVMPVDRAVARRAAQIRAEQRLRLPDALIVATAQLAACVAIVGNDLAWRGKTEPCEFTALDPLL